MDDDNPLVDLIRKDPATFGKLVGAVFLFLSVSSFIDWLGWFS